MAKKKRSTYVCQSCGHSAARWFGRCAACGEWNSCVEERPVEEDRRRDHIAATPTNFEKIGTDRIQAKNKKQVPNAIFYFLLYTA